MSLLRIFDAPEFYLQTIDIKDCNTYSKLMDHFFKNNYGQSNFLGNELSKNGMPTLEIIPNFKKAQVQWATENNIRYNLNNWKIDILFHQIQKYKPNYLFFVGWNYGYHLIEEIKNKFTFIKKAILWMGESIPEYKMYEHFDLILTCDPKNIDIFRLHNKKSIHINHAFAPEILNNVISNKTNSIGFAGSIKQGVNEHNYRANLLYSLLNKIEINLHGTVNYSSTFLESTLKGLLSKRYHLVLSFIKNSLNNELKFLPKSATNNEIIKQFKLEQKFKLLKSKIKKPLYGLDYLNFINQSTVFINSHSNTPYACNMRMFETTGIGTCLLSDWKENIPQLFVPNQEIVCYKSTDDLIEKALYLFENPKEAIKIGEKGQLTTLKNHTYSNRVYEYIHAIQND